MIAYKNTLVVHFNIYEMQSKDNRLICVQATFREFGYFITSSSTSSLTRQNTNVNTKLYMPAK